MVSFEKYFCRLYGRRKGTAIYESIRKQMNDILISTFDAVKDTINPKNLKNCFQILGYDFMIDDNFKVWLIEINTNPGMNFDSIEQPFKALLFPRMIEEAFQISVDVNLDIFFRNIFLNQ